jgi:hypothetical protein
MAMIAIGRQMMRVLAMQSLIAGAAARLCNGAVNE